MDTQVKKTILGLTPATIVVPAAVGNFVAHAKFVENTIDHTKVLIAKLFPEFLDQFVSRDVVVETPKPARILRCYELLETSMDDQIIAALGGESKAETTLADIFWVLEQQKSGESGPLLKSNHNGIFDNIFYVKNLEGSIGPVVVDWRVGVAYAGWRVYTPIKGTKVWRKCCKCPPIKRGGPEQLRGCHVFSPGPIPLQADASPAKVAI